MSLFPLTNPGPRKDTSPWTDLLLWILWITALALILHAGGTD